MTWYLIVLTSHLEIMTYYLIIMSSYLNYGLISHNSDKNFLEVENVDFHQFAECKTGPI